MPSVLVAMSGGVDSGVAACLLQEQGYECCGATMVLQGRADSCGAGTDVDDARQTCLGLGIPHVALDFCREFDELVVSPFAHAYETGLTPNPCVTCNRLVKFGILAEYARKGGFDYLATGHYARIVNEGGAARLAKAADASKDQSYFLHALSPQALSQTLLPLGALDKASVREMAAQRGLKSADRAESQDICFVPDGDYLAFLEKRRGGPYPHGDILTTDGRVVGTHRGAAGYTIGQRKGLGVALLEPMYVCAKDMAANTVTLGPSEALMANSCVVEDWSWAVEVPTHPLSAAAKTHYRQREQPCRVVPEGPRRVRLVFDAPQRAMTPGQAAVAYAGDVVLGGGPIASVETTL